MCLASSVKVRRKENDEKKEGSQFKYFICGQNLVRDVRLGIRSRQVNAIDGFSAIQPCPRCGPCFLSANVDALSFSGLLSTRRLWYLHVP